VADPLRIAHLLIDQPFCPLHEAGEHAHAIQRLPLSGVMDVGLHTGRIRPQLTPFGHPGLLGQLHHLGALARALSLVAEFASSAPQGLASDASWKATRFASASSSTTVT
jgi:hypothetical protein